MCRSCVERCYGLAIRPSSVYRWLQTASSLPWPPPSRPRQPAGRCYSGAACACCQWTLHPWRPPPPPQPPQEPPPPLPACLQPPLPRPLAAASVSRPCPALDLGQFCVRACGESEREVEAGFFCFSSGIWPLFGAGWVGVCFCAIN